MSEQKIEVGILLGSDSDLEVMRESQKILKDFGIGCEITIASAHRTPAKVMEYCAQAESRGLKVIIAGAGMAAHLAGVIAAHTILPVIGVPLAGSHLQGLDSLLSTVQMPAGIPVATVAIGSAGAKNAAHLAVQMIALGNPELTRKIKDFRAAQAEKIAEKNKGL